MISRRAFCRALASPPRPPRSVRLWHEGGAALPYNPEAAYGTQATDVEYLRVGGESFLARIHQPQGQGPFPALLALHGGLWTTQDRTGLDFVADALAASGLVVAAMDFRGSRTAPYPASVADVNYGVRWLKAHARDFGADPAIVGGLGSSSGGHLIVLSSMRPADPRYAALPLPEGPLMDATVSFIVGGWSPFDPYALYFRYQQRLANPAFLASMERYFVTEDAMQEGNPQLILNRGEPAELPPLLILQGTNDETIDYTKQVLFAQTYATAGGLVELALFPGMPHAFGFDPGPGTDRAIALTKSFIRRQIGAG